MLFMSFALSPPSVGPQGAVGAAILGVHAAALGALAHPLAAPRLVGAAEKAAKVACRSCGAKAGPALPPT